MTKIEEEDFDYILNKIDLNYFSGKTFLITGATGFIATNIIKFLYI